MTTIIERLEAILPAKDMPLTDYEKLIAAAVKELHDKALTIELLASYAGATLGHATRVLETETRNLALAFLAGILLASLVAGVW